MLSAIRQQCLALWLRVGVVAVILAGTLLSSLGTTSSHGLAALAATEHADCCTSDADGHSHDVDAASAFPGDPGHAHHGADHSHENGHSAPAMHALRAPQDPPWRAARHQWVAWTAAYRLERPPRA